MNPNPLKMLALELSGPVGSAALALGDRLLAARTITAGMHHGRDLLPALDGLVSEAGWSPDELQLLALSIGPGSFTGLRIGVMFARAAAWRNGLRVVGVPTLRAVAEQAPPTATRIAVVTDAQRGGVYWAEFERPAGGELQYAVAEKVGPIEEAVHEIAPPSLVIGSGLEKFAELLAPWAKADPQLWRPQAGTIAQLGWQMHLRDEHTPAEKLEPLYVRRPAPEEVWQRRERGGK